MNFLPKYLKEGIDVINPEYSKVTFKFNNKYVNLTHNRIDNQYTNYSTYYLQNVFSNFNNIKVITNIDKKYFIMSSNNKIKFTKDPPTIDNIKNNSYLYYRSVYK